MRGPDQLARPHRCPVRLRPAFWCTKSGRLIGRGPPLSGSGWVVSPVPIITQPRSSSALVRKSPRRRSWPVATHVVPPWHTVLLTWIGRPTGSTTVDCAVDGESGAEDLRLAHRDRGGLAVGVDELVGLVPDHRDLAAR